MSLEPIDLGYAYAEPGLRGWLQSLAWLIADGEASWGAGYPSFWPLYDRPPTVTVDIFTVDGVDCYGAVLEGDLILWFEDGEPMGYRATLRLPLTGPPLPPVGVHLEQISDAFTGWDLWIDQVYSTSQVFDGVGPLPPAPTPAWQRQWWAEVITPVITDLIEVFGDQLLIDAGPVQDELETWGGDALGGLARYTVSEPDRTGVLAPGWWSWSSLEIPEWWQLDSPQWLRLGPAQTGGEDVDLTPIVTALDEIKASLDNVAAKETRISINRGAVVYTVEAGDITEEL